MAGTSSLAVRPFTIRWNSIRPVAAATSTTIRNVRDGPSHSHRQNPAITVASTIRSLKSSSRAPRRDTR